MLLLTSHDQLYAVAEALKQASVTIEGQKFTFIPDTTVPGRRRGRCASGLAPLRCLEDDDDVQNVYSNLDIPEELLAKLPA